MTRQTAPKREFTGRHMAAIMMGFFGVVIVVNLIMASFAVRTFGGTVVDNSYVASQQFNSWLEEARRQAGFNWTVQTRMEPTGPLVSRIQSEDGPLSGARVEAVASHPLGREPERRLVLSQVEPGLYRSEEPLAHGRWIIRLTVSKADREARYLTEVTP